MTCGKFCVHILLYSLLAVCKIVEHRYIISSQIKIISYFKWDILMNISTYIFLQRLLADLLIYYLLRGNLEIMKSFICRNQKFDKAVTIPFCKWSNSQTKPVMSVFGTTTTIYYNHHFRLKVWLFPLICN